MYATDESIGVRQSDTYEIYHHVPAVGPYYNQPVKLKADKFYMFAPYREGRRGQNSWQLRCFTAACQAGQRRRLRPNHVARCHSPQICAGGGYHEHLFVINNEVITLLPMVPSLKALPGLVPLNC